MSFCRQAPKIHRKCCTSPVRPASDHEQNSADSEREQFFKKPKIDEESAETPQVCEKSEIADQVESSQRIVDQDFTDLPSCSSSERVCSSLRQRNGVVLGCHPNGEDI